MLASALIAMLAAAEPVKLAVPELGLVGIEKERGGFMIEALGIGLAQPGVAVVTAKDIAAVVGLDRQRQLLGCSNEGASCLSELANALGADGVVVGDLAIIGKAFRAQLKVVKATDGSVLARRVVDASTEEQFLSELGRAGSELAGDVLVAFGRAQPKQPGRPKWPWGVAVGGAVLAGVGAGMFVMGKSDAAQIANATPATRLSGTDARMLAAQGSMFETVGVALLVSGAVVLVAGVAVGAVTLVAAPAPGGGGAAFIGGTF